MQYLTKTIEQGAKIAGDQKQLEIALGLGKGTITEVKAGRRGLPLEACYKLADMTGADVARLVADNATVTEKKPEAVAYWRKKLDELERLAACVVIGSVATVVTPSPAEAAKMLQVTDFSVYIMSN